MSTDTRAVKRKLTWKLRLVMVSKGINTATELKRRLEKYPYDITTTHAARIVNGLPQRISSDLFEALVNVLGCTPGDLLVMEDMEVGQAKEPANNIHQLPQIAASEKTKRPPKRTKVVADESDTEYFGPRAVTLPKPTYDETIK